MLIKYYIINDIIIYLIDKNVYCFSYFTFNHFLY